PPSLSNGAGMARRRISLAAFCILGIMIAAIALYALFPRVRVDSAPISSIAVLPFQNESGNSDIDYVSDGITESLISSLARLPRFSIKSHSAVSRYKDKEVEPRQVAAELSVQAVLSGSIVQHGDDLALYLSLVDARAGDQLWGEQYHRKLADLPSL